MDELNTIIYSITKDKRFGLDGWYVKFYLSFFDLIREELLNVMEEVRISGKFYGVDKFHFSFTYSKVL